MHQRRFRRDKERRRKGPEGPLCPRRGRGAHGYALIVLACLTAHYAQAGEYFHYLYQRTAYTDNLAMVGAWWSNPAVAASIDAPYAHTANVLPLGDSLLISSFRMFVPLPKGIVTGAGILGAGGYKLGTSSAQAEGGSLTYQSRFAFSRPRFQLGAAAALPYVGSIGALGTVGSDVLTGGEGSVSPGIGFGWLSPLLLKSLQLSMAVMFIHHDIDTTFWESGGKLGFLGFILDSLVTASCEYTFSLGERGKGFGVFSAQAEEAPEYEVLKALVSLRLFTGLAVLAGYSTDIDYDFSNWHMAHLGLELCETPDSPFLGGYDIGFRFGTDWIITHRIWVGLNFRTLRQMKSRAEE